MLGYVRMGDFSRRNFLKGAAGGFAFSSGMFQKAFPYLIPRVVADPRFDPGVWSFIASTCRECPAGCGIHLWHRDGRVTKAEGNPLHPLNQGALCPRGQAALQGLYDPDRLSVPINPQKQTVVWPMAIEEIGNLLREKEGHVAILSRLETGPAATLLQAFARAFGSDRVLFYEPFSHESLRMAHAALFDRPVVPRYNLETAQFILSLGVDIFESWVSTVEHAVQATRARDFQAGNAGRMAYVGPRYSMTASNADLYVQCDARDMFYIAMAILEVVVANGWAKADVKPLAPLLAQFAESGRRQLTVSPGTILALAQAFGQSSGSVALAGGIGDTATGYATAVAAGLLNYAGGALDGIMDFDQPHAVSNTATRAETERFLESLTPDDVLFIHDANIAYSKPDSIGRIERAGLSIYMGTLPDETAELAQWVLPIDHALERWDVYEPYPGVHSVLQPTLPRLYDTLSMGDILLGMTQVAERPLTPPGGGQAPSDYEGWVRAYRATLAGSEAGDATAALRAGGIWETPPPGRAPKLRAQAVDLAAIYEPAGEGLTLWPWAPIMLFDGRVANHGWLQENPEPATGVTWGSWADLNPVDAGALGIADGDWAVLTTAAGRVVVTARVTGGIAPGVVALPFGQGHTAMGRLAAGRGVNAFSLLSAATPLPEPLRVAVRKAAPGDIPAGALPPPNVVATQSQHGRPILRWIPYDQARAMAPGAGEALILPLPEGYDPARDIYAPHIYRDHRWAMVVDLDRCIGCGACAVACYAENNVPVVGEANVREGREMAWLKVVPYLNAEEPPMRRGWLPMLCQHCDAAPCEPVCPTYASVHNDQGLNAQVYNRCIGTRYCSNNCPYKVRRFGWHSTEWAPPLQLQLNPEVSVRSRGVMEKCTFCIQRILQAEHRAKLEGRPLRDGDVVPACAQTCPTRAIIFGDLMDPESRVSSLTRLEPRRYHVLEELNTKPAVTYLMRTIRTI